MGLHDSDGIVVKDCRDVFGWELVRSVADQETGLANSTIADDDTPASHLSWCLFETTVIRHDGQSNHSYEQLDGELTESSRPCNVEESWQSQCTSANCVWENLTACSPLEASMEENSLDRSYNHCSMSSGYSSAH